MDNLHPVAIERLLKAMDEAMAEIRQAEIRWETDGHAAGLQIRDDLRRADRIIINIAGYLETQ